MLVLFVALVAIVSIAYKLFQQLRKRDITNDRTEKILDELTEELKHLRNHIAKRKD